jgi:hypothetical protein
MSTLLILAVVLAILASDFAPRVFPAMHPAVTLLLRLVAGVLVFWLVTAVLPHGGRLP